MRKIINKTLTIVGLALFILGVCSADSECLLFPIVMTFGGLAILWPQARDYEESEDDAEW